MALPIRRLFMDVDTSQVYRNFNDYSAAPTIYFTKGDDVKFDVVLVRQTGVPEFPMETVPITYAANGSSTLSIGDSTTTVVSGAAASAIPTPVLSAGSITGPYFTFSIDQQANYGSFILTFTKSSPYLSVSTAPILYPFTTTDIETAVKAAINSGSGWSGATCTVIPTGGLSGQIQVTGVYSYTTYNLALSSTTMTVTSSLIGFTGLRYEFADSGTVATYLGSLTEKAATLEFIAKASGEQQCMVQAACVVRDTVGA